MKFDTKTLEVLKNFSTINPSIKFVKGTVLKTVSPTKTILAKANITTDIESDFCIGELSRFMSALSLFSAPELVLGESQCSITDGVNKVDYTYTAEQFIKLPPDKEIVLPSIDIQFTLTNDMLQAMRKAISVLSLTEMAVVGENGKLFLKGFNLNKTSGDSYSIDIGETKKTFQVVFKAEYLKMMPYDYEVTISSKGISKFTNPEVEYIIVIEASDSKFE